MKNGIGELKDYLFVFYPRVLDPKGERKPASPLTAHSSRLEREGNGKITPIKTPAPPE